MRVLNDDRLIAGAIWPLHPHRDVEGLTYVVEGLFGHQDDAGGAYGPLPAGSVPRQTVGGGGGGAGLGAGGKGGGWGGGRGIGSKTHRRTSRCGSSRSGSCPTRPD